MHGGRPTATIPILLELRGERLRVGWNREPIVEMQRCRWTPALSYHWVETGAMIQEPDGGASR